MKQALNCDILWWIYFSLIVSNHLCCFHICTIWCLKNKCEIALRYVTENNTISYTKWSIWSGDFSFFSRYIVDIVLLCIIKIFIIKCEKYLYTICSSQIKKLNLDIVRLFFQFLASGNLVLFQFLRRVSPLMQATIDLYSNVYVMQSHGRDHQRWYNFSFVHQ